MTTKTQTNESSKSTKRQQAREVTVMSDDGTTGYPEVADAAEVTEGRVQLAFLDGRTEMVDGFLFAVFEGTWKMWMDDGRGILKAAPVESPILTLPFTSETDVIQFEYDGYEQQKAGRIKRLKRYDL